MKIIYILCLVLICINTYSQNSSYSGLIKNKENNKPLGFVSIGIVGKEIGTVSSENGHYSLEISSEFDNDSIKFSCIGYLPFVEEVKKYKLKERKDIFLEPKSILLNEVVVVQSNLKENILGNKYKKGPFIGGFRENNKGFECGVLLKIKKETRLQQLVCNIAECTYDSIMYRVNIYDAANEGNFINILDRAIYIKQKIDKRKITLEVDLSPYNIIVDNNILITLEHITDMGEGHLLFAGSLFKGSSCYFRKKSYSEWNKTPLKLGFSVKVLEAN